MPRLLAAILTSCIAATTASAQRLSVLESVGRLPGDVDAIVAIDDAQDFAHSPIGESILQVLRLAGGFHGTRDAWNALARQMGMSSQEAFDALLGGQTIFAARWSDGEMAWAILTELTPDAERRVRHSFRPSPRGVVGGRPVLAVEGGVLEMVLAPHPRAPRLLLGAAADRSLFTELATTLDAPASAPFSNNGLFREIERVGRRADSMVFFRSPTERALWFALVGERTNTTLTTNFLLGVPGLAEHGAQIEPWSRATFERLAETAYVAVLDMSEFSWQGEPTQGAGGIGAFAGLGLPLELAPELSALLSDRFALVIRPGQNGPIELAMALETVDTSEMARAGDRLLSRYLRGLATDDSACARLEGFEQMPPTAVRSVDVSQLVGSMRPFGWDAGPHVTWGSRVAHHACNAGQHHGWWTVGLGADAVQDLGRSMIDDDDDDLQPAHGASLPWLSLGMIRPAALIERLESAGVMLPPMVRPLRDVHEVSWQALEAGRGIVQGFGRIVVSGDDSAPTSASPPPGAVLRSR